MERTAGDRRRLIELDTSAPIWDSFFSAASLVIIGTLEPDGTPDLAPKHMCGPMGWSNLFGFVCSETHATQRNAARSGVFTVSYPEPSQIVQASLAAAPRLEDDTKPSLDALPTVPASHVDGVLLADSRVYLECELERIVEDLGSNSLIVGRIVAARVLESALRDPDRDDADVLAESPLLAYLPPGRFSSIAVGYSFPFHEGWHR